MSFLHGISGINSASRALDIISNNIANTQTIGFKSSNARFSDIMSESIGLGVQLNCIEQDFSNGSFIAGLNDLNIAISGNGFFNLIDDDGKIYYSRNGEFKISKNGEIINQQNKYLLGYKPYGTPPVINSNVSLEKIVLPNSIMQASPSNEVYIKENLPANIKHPEIKIFDSNDRNSYNFQSQVKVYDSMGNIHFIKIFYVKLQDERSWKVYCYDDTSPIINEKKEKILYSKDLKFDEFGNLKSSQDNKINIFGDNLNGSDKLNILIDFSKITQIGPTRKINMPLVNGHGVGELISFYVNDKGEIISKYSNQQNLLTGKIAISSFVNNNGLKKISDNCWVETNISGSPIVGTSGEGCLGSIKSRMLESSNVDLGSELVKMIVQQRNYQSNIQSIKVQDQLLQTLINIR